MTDAALLPHVAIRAATAADHERIDAAFAGYDLADRASYAAFLIAHARALPAIETALRDREDLPGFATRRVALAADLATLGQSMPPPIAIVPPASSAEAWGMLYVIEGSRLGGVMLARAVPDDLPKAYLSAAHARGGWKALLTALDEAGSAGGDRWLDEAIAAARHTFDLYGKAVSAEVMPG